MQAQFARHLAPHGLVVARSVAMSSRTAALGDVALQEIPYRVSEVVELT